MTQKYKIYHRSSSVFVIDVALLPILDMEGVTFLDKALVSADYHIALEAILSTKAVEVTPTEYAYLLAHPAHKEQLFVLCPTYPPCERPIDIYMKEGELYDLPEGFEVKISNRVDIAPLQTDVERVHNISGAYQVATIHPIEQQQPEEPSQDELWADVSGYFNKLNALTVTMPHPKTKYHLTRRS